MSDAHICPECDEVRDDTHVCGSCRERICESCCRWSNDDTGEWFCDGCGAASTEETPRVPADARSADASTLGLVKE